MLVLWITLAAVCGAADIPLEAKGPGVCDTDAQRAMKKENARLRRKINKIQRKLTDCNRLVSEKSLERPKSDDLLSNVLANRREDEMYRRQKELEDAEERDKLGVDAVELMKMIRKMFRNKKQQRPVFLVIYGPPGSGKTHIREKVAEQYHYNLKNNFLDILQDDMVKEIPDYRDDMRILNDKRDLYKTPSGGLNDTYYNMSEKVYKKYRNVIKQMKGIFIDNAFRQRLNIAYETTGKKRRRQSGATLFDYTVTLFDYMSEAKALGYEIVLIYPYVTRENLLSRLEKRNRIQQRVVKPSKLQGEFIPNAKLNFMYYAKFADRAYIFDNNIAKTAPLRALFKYKANSDPERVCSRLICKYPAFWENLVDDDDEETPLCVNTCVGPGAPNDFDQVLANKEPYEPGPDKAEPGVVADPSAGTSAPALGDPMVGGNSGMVRDPAVGDAAGDAVEEGSTTA